jgi:hypothetical protein
MYPAATGAGAEAEPTQNPHGGFMSQRQTSRTRHALKRFTQPIKLWVEPPMYRALKKYAAALEWTVPQVIRRFIREGLERLANEP